MADTEDGAIGVLVVDDHRLFAEGLARLLGDEDGIQVVGLAATGPEAVELAARLKPRVALLDYQLPGQDGIDLAHELKRNDPRIMIVMLTGSADDRVLVRAIDAGCSGFLTKDRAAAEVADAVRAVAAGEALISPALLARLLPRLSRTHRALGDDLTDRERAVLNLVVRGWPNKAIADDLHLSVNTVRNYVQSILTKLQSHSKLEAVATAVREGIIEYPSD